MASRLALINLLLATSSAAYHCTNFFDVHINFDTSVLKPNFPPFDSQLDAITFLQNSTRRTRDFVAYGEATNITLDVGIAAKYCTPNNGSSNGVTQILTHGGGFDHRYWEFGGPTSENNYVKAVTEAGYSVLLYDRLGASVSSHPDPYKVVQMPVQAEILAKLTKGLRNGALTTDYDIPVPKKVAHVGHSIGSAITSGFIARYPDLTNAAVLTGFSTGFSTDPAATGQFPIASNLQIAAELNPQAWGELSKGYWTWTDEAANQFLFLWHPYFTKEALEEAERNKVPSSIGELATSIPSDPAVYTGPLLIFSGDRDQVLCGGECNNLLGNASDVYTGAKPFNTYVQPNTGHGITAHKNATAGYKVINDFIASVLTV